MNFAQIAMRRQLQQLETWTKHWRIKINAQKSQAVTFTKRRPQDPPPLLLFNHPIPYQRTAKYLGITLDNKLTFGQHITDLAMRAKQRTTALAPMLRTPTLKQSTRYHIYKAIIRAMMSYASAAWLHAAQVHLNRLQRVQNHALRLISGHDRSTRIMQIHEDTETPFLEEHLRRLQLQFWTRLRAHPDPEVQNIGTNQARRQMHRTPRIP